MAFFDSVRMTLSHFGRNAIKRLKAVKSAESGMNARRRQNDAFPILVAVLSDLN